MDAMTYTATLLVGGKPLCERRPFSDYRDQPDTAERVRLQIQALPFGLPERREEANAANSLR